MLRNALPAFATFIATVGPVEAARIGGSTISAPESVEARAKNDDIAVFPLATSILAGPGAMSGAMVLMVNAKGNIAEQLSIIAALLMVMAITLVLMLAAQELREWIGVTAQRVIMRVFGILLAAIAVQSLFNGIAGSGIFYRPRASHLPGAALHPVYPAAIERTILAPWFSCLAMEG